MNVIDPLVVRRAHRVAERRGAVIVVVLIAMMLLAAMAFYVVNVGKHVAYRVETQNAADAAVISGAGWVARSFNTVAMNNVESVRMIALANVLDAFPKAIEYTLADQIAVKQALDRQINNGAGIDSAWVVPGLEEARNNIEQQILMLQPMDDLFNNSGYDVAAVTVYDGPNGRGSLWQAVEAMNGLSLATMENLSELAGYNAFRGGQINQREGGKAGGGIMLPTSIDVPWEQGSFDDFRPAISQGLLPDDQDDKVLNRGPYDTILAWRRFRAKEGVREPDDRTISDDFDNPWVRDRPRRTISAKADTYYTFGPYQFIRGLAMSLGTASGYPTDQSGYMRATPTVNPDRPLVPSQWARRVGFLADQKIAYAYPELSRGGRQNRQPQWITDYNTAEEIIDDPNVTDKGYGMWVVLDFEVTYENNIPSNATFIEWGLYRDESSPPKTVPPNLSTNKLAEHIWKDQRIYQTAAGVETHTLRYYVWVGLNIGPEDDNIRNPNNFDEEDRNFMPGPINFTVGEFPFEQSSFDQLTYFGIAHQPKGATFWPSMFDADRPDQKMMATAQAVVFNNHSWDLWTQMWHAQLVPVSDYSTWIDELKDVGSGDGNLGLPWLSAEDQQAVTDFLEATAPMADYMMEH